MDSISHHGCTTGTPCPLLFLDTYFLEPLNAHIWNNYLGKFCWGLKSRYCLKKPTICLTVLDVQTTKVSFCGLTVVVITAYYYFYYHLEKYGNVISLFSLSSCRSWMHCYSQIIHRIIISQTAFEDCDSWIHIWQLQSTSNLLSALPVHE